MASFAGVDFNERGQGAKLFPTWGRKADSAITHIPGGNKTIIDSSGLLADRLQLAIRCTESQLNSLYSKVDTVGSLVYARGTFQAYLDEISDPVEILASGKFFTTLHFIRQ